MSNKWSPEIQYKPILSIILNYIENWDFWLLVDLALLHNDRVFADFIIISLDNEERKDLVKTVTSAIGKKEIEKVVRNRFISPFYHKKEWFEWDSFIDLMKTEKNHASVHNNGYYITGVPWEINFYYAYKITNENYKSNEWYFESRNKNKKIIKHEINDCVFLIFIF